VHTYFLCTKRCTYICICIYMCVCVCVCVCVYVYVCVQRPVRVCMYACMHARNMYIFVCTHKVFDVPNCSQKSRPSSRNTHTSSVSMPSEMAHFALRFGTTSYACLCKHVHAHTHTHIGGGQAGQSRMCAVRKFSYMHIKIYTGPH
jgi:hypothetical protein